jgi:hypothetical protein
MKDGSTLIAVIIAAVGLMVILLLIQFDAKNVYEASSVERQALGLKMDAILEANAIPIVPLEELNDE